MTDRPITARGTPGQHPLIGHALFGLQIALEAVRHNTLRALLTSLGILFGVASVIAMLAIGRGAQQEVLEQMQLLGSNNILVTPLVEQREGPVADAPTAHEVHRFAPGLSAADAEAMTTVLPGIDAVSGEIVLNTVVTRQGQRRSGKLVGVDPAYFRLTGLRVAEGLGFSEQHLRDGLPVAVIGQGIRSRFFTGEDPIGKPLKVGDVWVTVVGVLADRRLENAPPSRLGIRDANADVYIPTRTMLLRFRNRALVAAGGRGGGSVFFSGDGGMVSISGPSSGEGESDEKRQERTNPNQLDRIIVRAVESAQVPQLAAVMQRMLERRHNGVVNFEITVPELLLKQEQRTRAIFNVVLGAIASISLIVGGIGIMNIMLASVLERTREIGVRRAVGATQRDIGTQFLTEAVLISCVGGILGILVGVSLAVAIERLAGIQTIVSTPSVLIAFGVSLAVGIGFGFTPAARAARQDPVVSLRYE